jgi:type IV pilus modification protein PilV
MKTNAFSRRQTTASHGFSLIEILIAVVVLSFGLLALASLQTSLMRSSAETKSQTVALSLAKDRVEQLRSFANMAGYRSLTDVPVASAATISMGGVDYTLWQDVTRYAYSRANNRFEEVADTVALGADYVVENEFKRIVVRVGWTDASGSAQQLTLEDAVGAVTPENTARVASARDTSAARGPRVLIANPASEAGVIPIAIGDGSETAATNPRPRIAGNTNQSLQETSFDIFTYAALVDSANALAQSRIENYIVGCLCDTREAVASDITYRPAYWNGKRYVPPTRANYNPLAGPADLGRGNRADSQSPLCDQCCRDHQDPPGIGGAKFSPRFSEHKHYKWDMATGQLVPGADGLPLPVTSGEYNEACRVIRVDGILRVAADTYDDYFNLLKTAGNFTSPVPDNNAIGLYQDFVLSYLGEQFVAGNGYNTPLSQERADALALPLRSPTLQIREGDRRWFHSRGLFMDYLEPEAVSAITTAKSECAGSCTAEELSVAVLKTLPFTSINLTEVAGWKPSLFGDPGFDTVVVANSNFALAAQQVDPVRGLAAAKAAGTTEARSAIRRSTSSLVANPSFYISPADEPRKSDTQMVQVAGSDVTCRLGPTTLGSFGSTPPDPSDTARCVSVQASDYDGSAAATTLRVTIRFTAGTLRTGDTSIRLVGPAGGMCDFPLKGVNDAPSTNNAWPTTQSYTFSRKASLDPDCNPSVDGTWTLEVRNHRGQTATTAFDWKMTISQSASYTVNFTNYAFDPTGSTAPAITASPDALCNHPSGGNPYSCSTNTPGATAFTLGNYNYQTSLAGQNVTCATGKNNSPTLSCSNVTARQCTNFRVASVSNGEVPGTVGTVSNDGKPIETTRVSFANITDADVITIAMEQGASVMATCQATRCTSISWTCP